MGNSVIQSISYSKEIQKFLDENPDLSVSKIFQSKIIEIMESRRFQTEEKQNILRKMNTITNTLQSATEFISKKGLWDEYCDWENKKC